MTEFQLYAISSFRPQPLTVPTTARDFSDLYAGLALGIYSVWRSYDHNKFLHLEAHLDRIRRSMALLNWEYELNETAVRQAIHTICSKAPYPEMRVRLDILAEPARALGTNSSLLLALMSFSPPPKSMYENGVRLDFAPGLSRERPSLKMADFAVKRRAFSGDAYEYLLLDSGGRILEGTGSNFYGVREGVVLTADEGVLNGVTRQIVLELLPQLEIPLRLEPVHKDEISSLDEAAMSSSSRALLPVVEIAGQQIGSGRPGPISQRILAAYNHYVASALKTAV